MAGNVAAADGFILAHVPHLLLHFWGFDAIALSVYSSSAFVWVWKCVGLAIRANSGI
jgi:hypothetical protein